MPLFQEHISSDEDGDPVSLLPVRVSCPHRLFQIAPFQKPLSSASGLNADASKSTSSVLKAHHKKNRPPRPPTAENLARVRAASQVTLTSSAHNPRQSNSVASEVESDTNSTVNESRSNASGSGKRAKRHSITPYQGRTSKPTQLNFYPGQWQDILEVAKRKYRLYLATKNAFPDREKDFGEARDCLTEAMQEHTDASGDVEIGIC